MHATTNERTAQASLARSRFVATILLVTAAVGYVLSVKYMDLSPYMTYVRAFCEASMVGGLADWFAVVALFKHPLGLPIPHTAILPKNQKRIAKQVSLFIEDNFLQPSVISKKIYDYQPSQLFFNWLSQTNNREKLSLILSRQLSDIINSIRPEWFSQLALQISQKKLTGQQLGYYLAILLTLLKNNGYAEKIFDGTIAQINKSLQNPEIRQKIEDNINTWAKKIETNVPPSKWQKFIRTIKGSAADLMDGWLANKIVLWMDKYCQDISNQPNHFIKETFYEKWQQLTHELEYSSAVQQKINIVIQQILASPAVKNFLQDNWYYFQTWLKQTACYNTSTLVTKLNELLYIIIEETLNNPEQMRKIDIQASIFIKEVITQYKSTAAYYIENRVSEWDSKQLVQKLELSIGKDLQYIRINGTLVGGLVGLIICWITQLSQQIGLI